MKPPVETDEPEELDESDVPLRALLKKSVAQEPSPPELLSGVQQKIRVRSRGKFYKDGWSTTSTRPTFLWIALAMLLVLVVAYVALGPTGLMAP